MGSSEPFRLADSRLEALVGTGSYGEVWRVRDRSGRVAALKRMLPHVARDAVAVAAFRREARLLARVQSESIPQLLASGEDETGPYLLLEYVNGNSLRRLTGTAVPLPVALRVAHDLLVALELVHELRGEDGTKLGLVHRDLSPGNVLISVEGRVKLADFGIARGQAGTVATTGYLAKGTLGYMSPEQARGEPLDGRSDLFSVGALLHELIAGTPPYDEDDPRLALARARAGDVEAFAIRQPEVPSCVADLIDRALSARAADRFPTAASMRAEVLLCAERCGGLATDDALGAWVKTVPRNETPAEEISGAPVLVSRAARSRERWIVSGLVALLAMGIGVGLWGAFDRTPAAVPHGTPSAPALPSAVASAGSDPIVPAPAPSASVAASSVSSAHDKPGEEAAPLKSAEPAAVPGFGWLDLGSSPSFAYVTIDGRSVGSTPVYGLKLKAGTHTVVVRRDGLGTKTLSVVVRSGQRASHVVTLP